MRILNVVFSHIVAVLAKGAIPFVVWGKKVTGWKTYRFEELFVISILSIVTIATGGLFSIW